MGGDGNYSVGAVDQKGILVGQVGLEPTTTGL